MRNETPFRPGVDVYDSELVRFSRRRGRPIDNCLRRDPKKKVGPGEQRDKMKCSLCKKQRATVRVTHDPKPGEVVRVDLCQKCARKHGIDDPTGFSLADLLCAIRNKTDSN